MALVHVALQVVFVHEPVLAVAALELALDAALEPQVARQVRLPAELAAALRAREARAGGRGRPTVAPPDGQRRNYQPACNGQTRTLYPHRVTARRGVGVTQHSWKSGHGLTAVR